MNFRKMRRDLKVQIKVLAVAIFIVFLIAVTGCSGSYRFGTASKIYCSAIGLASGQSEINKVANDKAKGVNQIETNVEH